MCVCIVFLGQWVDHIYIEIRMPWVWFEQSSINNILSLRLLDSLQDRFLGETESLHTLVHVPRQISRLWWANIGQSELCHHHPGSQLNKLWLIHWLDPTIHSYYPVCARISPCASSKDGDDDDSILLFMRMLVLVWLSSAKRFWLNTTILKLLNTHAHKLVGK